VLLSPWLKTMRDAFVRCDALRDEYALLCRYMARSLCYGKRTCCRAKSADTIALRVTRCLTPLQRHLRYSWALSGYDFDARASSLPMRRCRADAEMLPILLPPCHRLSLMPHLISLPRHATTCRFLMFADADAVTSFYAILMAAAYAFFRC